MKVKGKSEVKAKIEIKRDRNGKKAKAKQRAFVWRLSSRQNERKCSSSLFEYSRFVCV